MKTKTTLSESLLACSLFCLLLASCASPRKDVSAELSDHNKGFMEAVAKGDAAAMASQYTSDAKMFPMNQDVIEGQESVEKFWAASLKQGLKKLTLETVKADGFGEVAIEEGRYKVYTDGDKMVDQGKYLAEWKGGDGKWKLQNLIWNTNNPAPQARAVANDSVLVVMNHIKPDKVKQFEEFNFKILEPAAAKNYPIMRNTVRTLKPIRQNTDKTYTYIYLMDAATSPDGYDMKLPLTAEYGEAKANEYLKMFTDCLKGGDQEAVMTVQTAW